MEQWQVWECKLNIQPIQLNYKVKVTSLFALAIWFGFSAVFFLNFLKVSSTYFYVLDALNNLISMH